MNAYQFKVIGDSQYARLVNTMVPVVVIHLVREREEGACMHIHTYSGSQVSHHDYLVHTGSWHL